MLLSLCVCTDRGSLDHRKRNAARMNILLKCLERYNGTTINSCTWLHIYSYRYIIPFIAAYEFRFGLVSISLASIAYVQADSFEKDSGTQLLHRHESNDLVFNRIILNFSFNFSTFFNRRS